MTSCLPTTRTRPPGTRSAGGDLPARAAMCAWATTSAIRGRRRRSRTATWPRPKGRTAMSDDPLETIRATGGRAPDVFAPGGWIPMRQYSDDELVDFVIVG